MNFETLRYFISVAEAGSISKAADSLSISQQGLNKAVTTLENELGCKLISRTQHGIDLTEDGKQFLIHSKKILSDQVSMFNDLEQFRQSVAFLKTTHMRIITSPVCMFIVMNPMIEKFDLPNTTIQEKTTEETFQLMEKTGCAYLVDVFKPLYPEESFSQEYHCIPLAEAKFGIMARKNLVPDLPRVITSEFAARLPLGLFLTETTRAMYEHIFKDHPLKNVLLTTGSRSTLIEGAAAGRYAVPIDSFHWEQISGLHREGADKMVFSEIAGNYSVMLAFVNKKTNPLNATQKEYLEKFAQVYSSIIALKNR